jgi:hypothetical protein
MQPRSNGSVLLVPGVIPSGVIRGAIHCANRGSSAQAIHVVTHACPGCVIRLTHSIAHPFTVASDRCWWGTELVGTITDQRASTLFRTLPCGCHHGTLACPARRQSVELPRRARLLSA